MSALAQLHRHAPHLFDTILSHLRYPDLIALSQVSRQLRHAVADPAARASYDDKAAFVQLAESKFAQHFPRSSGSETPGSFACFWCFRVRGPEHFDDWQDMVYWDSVERRVERVDEEDPQRGGLGSGPLLLLPSSSSSSSSSSSGPLSSPSSSPSLSLRTRASERVASGRLMYLRRFCIDCGLGHGLYGAGDSIRPKARGGDELWVCGCRMLSKKITTKCEECGDVAPMRPRKRRY